MSRAAVDRGLRHARDDAGFRRLHRRARPRFPELPEPLRAVVAHAGEHGGEHVRGARSGDALEQLVDLDPLLYFGKVGSAFTRLSTSELANVTAGGGMVPTFIIKEKV